MKTLGTLSIAVLLLLMQFHCERASAHEDDSLRVLIRAQRLAQLPREENESDKARRLRVVCEKQLAMSLIPVSCFKLAALEHKPELKEWLDFLCEDRARKLNAVPDANLSELTVRCRTAIEERRDDLLYKRTTSDPLSVFRQRF